MNTSPRGAHVLDHMHLAFLFGMKVGAYMALCRVSKMCRIMTHEEVFRLGKTTDDILDQVEKAAKSGGGDIEAIIEERLQEARSGCASSLMAVQDLQEKIDEARITQSASEREVKFLEKMLKDLFKKEKP